MARCETERTPKAVLADVVSDLKVKHGLGNRTIAKLLGYSETFVRHICRDFQIGAARDQFAYIDLLVAALPGDMRSKVRAIKARNTAYWRHTTVNGSPALYCVHPNVDDDEKPCVNG